MKFHLAIAAGLGLGIAAEACTTENGCECPESHAPLASEPAFVKAGQPPVAFASFVVHTFNFDYSTNAKPGPIVDLQISAGDTVEWQNDEGFHTVNSVAGSEPFASPFGFTTFNHTFQNPGVYEYYCALHGFDNGNGTAGGMSGVITVLAIPEPTAAMLLGAVPLLRRRVAR